MVENHHLSIAYLEGAVKNCGPKRQYGWFRTSFSQLQMFAGSSG